MQFQAVVKDLSSSKLSERDISKRIIDGFSYLLDLGGELNKPHLIRLLNKAKDILIKAVPDDVLVNNIVRYLLYDIEMAHDIKHEIRNRFRNVEEHFDLLNKTAVQEGSKKIKENSRIFVLGYSKTILNILKKTKEKGKNFVVNNTELRPGHFGRPMADEVSKIGVYVNHYPDSAIRFALKDCDLALVDGLGVYGNKLISNLGIANLIDICEKEDVPVYVCLDGWKFGNMNKNLEVNQKSKINIINPGFEEADLDKVLIISELGILNGKVYSNQLKSAYPWINSSF